MSTPRQDFRQALSGDAPVLAANIFDPLSARIAQLLGYSVCVLSGSVAKAASLAVPDLVLANSSDLADACRRIMRGCPGEPHGRRGGRLRRRRQRHANSGRAGGCRGFGD